MCLMTVAQTSNMNEDNIEQDQLTSSQDGRSDFQIQINWKTDEDKEWTDRINFLMSPLKLNDKYDSSWHCSFDGLDQERYISSTRLHFVVPGDHVCLTINWDDDENPCKREYHCRFLGKISRSLEDIERLKNGYTLLENIKRLQNEKEIAKVCGFQTGTQKKEYIRHMFLMILLIILIKNISENIKYRQSSGRKNSCLHSILYLLWQSGDVEVNPGPPISITYRNWLYDVCSVVSKVIFGVSADCKMKKIWQHPPLNWPSEEPYFDPRNSNRSVNEVETLLQNLIQCCEDISKVPDEIISEVDTWNSYRSKDNRQLLNMYITRVCCRSAEKNVKALRSNLLVDEVLTFDIGTEIQVILSGQPGKGQQFPAQKIYRAEATRKMASFLCRIIKGKDPAEKSDNIWKEKPIDWPSDCRFYNPYNGGKRRAENEDARLVKELITLCGKKSITLPKPYKDMIDAWIADDQLSLSKLITRHTAETDVKKAVMKLHEERLLQDTKIDNLLKDLGLLVQCNGIIPNAKSQKRKMVNTIKKPETKRTKQSYHEDAVDTTLKELLPDCSIGQLFDNQSDSFLLDKISQNIPDFLGDEADDIQFHWTSTVTEYEILFD